MMIDMMIAGIQEIMTGTGPITDPTTLLIEGDICQLK